MLITRSGRAVSSFVDRTAEKRTFHTLDGLRGISAVFVVLFHYSVYLRPISVPNAYLAVDLFFIMSGFVIGLAYENRLRNSLSVPGFIKLRLVRLYPLYILGTLIGLSIPLIGMLHVEEARKWISFLCMAVPALFMLPGPAN